MPDSEPSHTASDPRKEDLASLFRGWDRRVAADGARARAESQSVRFRLVVTIALAAVALIVMCATRQSFAFWAEPGTPRDLGDVRAAHAARASQTLEAGHVAVQGLVPTRVVAVAAEPQPADTRYIFFCPLQHIVVLTRQRPAIDAAAQPDPRLADVVAAHLATAEETAAQISATGQLMRAGEAPSELTPFVQSFAQRTRLPPEELWVLVDGARPADTTWAAIVWALAAAAPLLSLAFLVRAWRAQRRHRPSFGAAS